MPQARSAKNKVQVDGRSCGLCWQLAEMCSATCWFRAEQTSLMGGAWAVPLRSGLYNTAGEELMRPKAETRSVLRREVSFERTWKVSSVWYVPGDQQEGPKDETRSALRRAVSSARSWKVSSVWYVLGDQQEGPPPSHCCCGRRCRRKGAPSIEKPPEKEQGLWARWKAKAKSLRKKHRRDWRNAATVVSQGLNDAICKVSL